MTTFKIISRLAVITACLLLLASGCTEADKETTAIQTAPAGQITIPPAPATDRVALKFNQGDSETYLIMSKTQRTVNFYGPMVEKENLQSGNAGTSVHIQYNQQIQDVDDNGNATAKITIEKVMYNSVVNNRMTVKFDSFKSQDPNNPLSQLIGQHYTVEIAPDGRILRVIETGQARAALEQGDSIAHKAAERLLSTEVIKQLHSIAPLPTDKKTPIQKGDSWSNTKTFRFGSFGSKDYERTFTVKGIGGRDGHQTAVIGMMASPQTSRPSNTAAASAGPDLSDMSAHSESYIGILELDLTTGKLGKYAEELQAEWVMIDTLADTDPNKEPDYFTIGVTQMHSITKMDETNTEH